MAAGSDKTELARMGFWDHVEALRGVLLKSGTLILALAVCFFVAMPRLFDGVILAPCHGDFALYQLFGRIAGRVPGFPDFDAGGFDVKLINIKLASQFFIHMSSSFWMALIVAFPMVVYWIWIFVAPGLNPNEKRGMRTAFMLGNLMFYIGVLVGYFLVFPLTLRFLAEYQVSSDVPNQISLESYMDNFVTLILMMGVVFELPLLAWLLGIFGLLDRTFFGRYRRHAVVALLVLTAVVTPTGDPFTLAVVFLPVYCLWELSAWLVPKRLAEPEEDPAPQPKVNVADSLRDLYIPQYKKKSE